MIMILIPSKPYTTEAKSHDLDGGSECCAHFATFPTLHDALRVRTYFATELWNLGLVCRTRTCTSVHTVWSTDYLITSQLENIPCAVCQRISGSLVSQLLNQFTHQRIIPSTNKLRGNEDDHKSSTICIQQSLKKLRLSVWWWLNE